MKRIADLISKKRNEKRAKQISATIIRNSRYIRTPYRGRYFWCDDGSRLYVFVKRTMRFTFSDLELKLFDYWGTISILATYYDVQLFQQLSNLMYAKILNLSTGVNYSDVGRPTHIAQFCPKKGRYEYTDFSLLGDILINAATKNGIELAIKLLDAFRGFAKYRRMSRYLREDTFENVLWLLIVRPNDDSRSIHLEDSRKIRRWCAITTFDQLNLLESRYRQTKSRVFVIWLMRQCLGANFNVPDIVRKIVTLIDSFHEQPNG
jgi:hypothetical protein